MPLKPDQKLGEYTIVASIGAGGMGEVYRAHDARLDRDVAIKVLPAAFARDPHMLARFEREAKAVAALSHPNILSVYDFGTATDTPYVVTELLEGETLRQRLDGGAIGPRKAAELGRQIARGLAAAHDKGIVHRDIKPDNLFVTVDGRVKILDFGLAAAKDEQTDLDTATRTSLTAPGTVLGTVAYMSPEQVRGEVLDSRSDIFSLGSVLYEMIFGEKPFVRDTAAEVMTAVLKEEPPDVTSRSGPTPPALLTIVRRCMEKKPGERFQSAHDLAFSLEALSTTTATSGPVPALDAATDPAPRRRWLAPALLLIVGLALGAAATALLMPRENRTLPSFTQLTSRRGTVTTARLLPDGNALYTAMWDGGPLQLYRSGDSAGPAMDLEGAELLSVSPSGELALALDRRFPIGWERIGTLAVAQPGTTPRPVLEDVLVADWAPDGSALAVAHEVDGVVRVEYPIGTEIYRSPGWISELRFHPDGQRLAIADHPVRGDNAAVIRIVGLNGEVQDVGVGGSWGLDWSASGRSIIASTGSTVGEFAPGRPRRPLYRPTSSMRILDVDPASGHALVASAEIRREMFGQARGADDAANLSWLDWSTPRILLPDGSRVFFEEGNVTNRDGYALFSRPLTGDAPLQLGFGSIMTVSPDGAWMVVLHRALADDQEVRIVPTGPGETRTIDIGDLRVGQWGSVWLPGGRGPDPGDTILFPGRTSDDVTRLYRLPLDGGAPPRAVTPEGFSLAAHPVALSPDGGRVVVKPASGAPVAVPVEGGPVEPLPGVEPGDLPLQFDRDGRHLYVLASNRLPGRLVRVDVVSGRRTPWEELSPADPAGVSTIDYVSVSADGAAFVYSVRRMTSRLLAVENLR